MRPPAGLEQLPSRRNVAIARHPAGSTGGTQRRVPASTPAGQAAAGTAALKPTLLFAIERNAGLARRPWTEPASHC